MIEQLKMKEMFPDLEMPVKNQLQGMLAVF